ncbi:hypothetical protein SVIOM342S_09235 [Streptomyces violaceorubidus]
MSCGDGAHAGRRGRRGGQDRPRWDPPRREDGNAPRVYRVRRAGRVHRVHGGHRDRQNLRDCRDPQARRARRDGWGHRVPGDHRNGQNRRDCRDHRDTGLRDRRDPQAGQAGRERRAARARRAARTRRGIRRLVLLGAVLGLLLLGGAGPASAHAALGSTDPGDGAVLQRPPGHVTLTFSESVGLRDDSFRVLDPGGHRVRTGAAGHADGRADTARAALPGELGEGTYTVAWRVVSADSHPVSGAFTFSVGKPSQTTARVDTGPTEDPLTATLHKLARYLSYLAAALLIGTAAFVALCRPPDPAPLRRPLVAGCWTLLAATVALLVLRAPYEAGTGPSSALDADALADTLTARPGVLLLTRLALLAPVALFLVRLSPVPHVSRAERHRRHRLLVGAVGGALAVGLALTWAAAEHASAGVQVPLAMTSATLHLLATAVWLGGLTALVLTVRSTADAATVARFSRVALASVTVLVTTGVYQSWRGLGSWQALTAPPAPPLPDPARREIASHPQGGPGDGVEQLRQVVLRRAARRGAEEVRRPGPPDEPLDEAGLADPPPSGGHGLETWGSGADARSVRATSKGPAASSGALRLRAR